MKKLKVTHEDKTRILKDITEQINNAKTLTELENIKITKDKTYLTKIKKPSIYIKCDVLEKMFALVNESSTECQWHGLVQRNPKENAYWIYDVLVFPQINSAASTDSDEEKYTEWLMQLDDNTIKHLRMHGHSHVNMEVYSSTIDDTFQEEILSNIKDDDYYIFFVLNKKREICILLYDFIQNIIFETKDIELKLTNKKGVISDWAKEQLKLNVEKQKTTPYYYNNYDPYGIYEYNYSPNTYKNTKKQSKISIQRRY